MTITISIPQIVINISNTNPNLNLEQMAHTLDELLQLATDQSTKEDSLFAIVNGLKTQLSDALAKAAASGNTDAAAIQAEVDQVFEKFTANTQKIADAITANTPDSGSTTPPVVPPVVDQPAPTTGTTPPVVDTPAPVDATPAPADGGTTAPVDVPATPVVDAPAPVDAPATPTTPGAPVDAGTPAAPTGPVTNPDGSTVI